MNRAKRRRERDRQNTKKSWSAWQKLHPPMTCCICGAAWPCPRWHTVEDLNISLLSLAFGNYHTLEIKTGT